MRVGFVLGDVPMEGHMGDLSRHGRRDVVAIVLGLALVVTFLALYLPARSRCEARGGHLVETWPTFTCMGGKP